MCNRDMAVLRAETARLSATAVSRESEALSDDQRKQNGAAGVDVEAWITQQASLISVEQFYFQSAKRNSSRALQRRRRIADRG
jgi:hypothetical protein